MLALIYKKLTEEEALPEVELAKDDNWVRDHLPMQKKDTKKKTILVPPSSSYVEKERTRRLQEMKMADITLEIGVYFVYIILALLIAYGHRDPDAYKMTTNMENLFIKGKFDKVCSYQAFHELTYMTAKEGRIMSLQSADTIQVCKIPRISERVSTSNFQTQDSFCSFIIIKPGGVSLFVVRPCLCGAVCHCLTQTTSRFEAKMARQLCNVC